MAEIKNDGAEWSVAYAVAIKRLDSQFMLCLLSLVKLPDLRHMHGDLVDHLHAICGLLAKRPMVGFLIARRLKLPVDKTFALLNVLLSKGYLHTVGANVSDVDPSALAAVKVLNSKIDKNQRHTDAAIPKVAINASEATANAAKTIRVFKENQSSGDVLNQLWRVLNTDIVMSKAARAKADPKSTNEKEAGEVLSQLWHVLNSDITVANVKQEVNKQEVNKQEVNKQATHKHDAAINDRHVLRDVNGHIIALEDEPTTGAGISTTHKSSDTLTAKDSKAVLSQLWEVLNADIAFKRETDGTVANQPASEKSKEITDVMSQLWRVLNTEIATKRQDKLKAGSDSLSDTTLEAKSKLKSFWQLLDAEIKLKKQPVTHAMRGPLASLSSDDAIDKDKAVDTSVEAASRLSQFWQVLNADITLAVPENKSVNSNVY